MMEKEKCYICGGYFEDALLDFKVMIGNTHIIITGVPGKRCSQCDEESLSLDIYSKIENFIKEFKTEKEIETVQYSKIAA